MSLKTHVLLSCCEKVLDRREVRGVRYPLASVLKLVIVCLICNQHYFAHMENFARFHWEELREALGFKRESVPDECTISRILSKIEVQQLQKVFQRWLIEVSKDQVASAAVDGKVAKQSTTAEGTVVTMLNIFEHNVRLTLASYPLKTTLEEPQVFQRIVKELCATYPGLGIFTLDALYAQRDLCETLTKLNKGYIVVLKDNQPDTRELIQRSFAKRKKTLPKKRILEKKRGLLSPQPTMKT